MDDEALNWERPRGFARGPVVWALLIVAVAVAAISAHVGFRGIPVTESFRLADARHIEGRLYLQRLDIDRWEQPPLQVIDDGRFGAEGTATEFFIDGAPVTDSRVSRGPLTEGARPGFLHTGLHNLYFTLGSDPAADPVLTVRYRVRLETPVTAAALLSAVLLALGAVCLAVSPRSGAQRLFDIAVLALFAEVAASLWLALFGMEDRRDIETDSIKALAPNGYLYRVAADWPFFVPSTDREAGLVTGRVLEDGAALGPPTVNGDDIRDKGEGRHIMGRAGLLYFSSSDNTDPRENGRRYQVEVRYFLSPHVSVALGGALLLLLLAAFATDRPGLTRMALCPRPRTVALALPLAAAGTVAAYFAWLASVDPLHFFQAPQPRDYFVRDEGYRMAGLVRTWPYEAIIVGTSISQNFYMAEASEKLGMATLNATIAGSRPNEQAALIRTALREHGARLVIWENHVPLYNLEAESLRSETFPFHLFDANPLNDLEYAFSLQAWLDAREARRARLTEETEALDPINKWGERRAFGPPLVAEEYCDRRQHRAGAIDTADLRRNFRRHVRPVIEDHPETEFVIFIPAYSALMHADPGGRLKDLEFSARMLHEELGDLPNVRIFDFQGLTRFVGDPALYRDASHYHPSVNSYILDAIAEGRHEVGPDALYEHESRLRESFADAVGAFRGVMDPYCDARKRE